MARPDPRDTIVAIATPLGQGGLGVVRLSGPDALPIASHLFQNPRIKDISSHTLHHGWVKADSGLVDEAVLALFRAPHSYTGEDVVEISCHGSPVVLKEIVSLAQAAGARHAAPGEFTERAYLNGKLDLLQAEAVAELIHANSSAARSAAAQHLKGALSQKIKALRDQLVELTAHIEANLDFVEEDIPGVLNEEMERRLTAITRQLRNLLSTSVKGRILREGLNVPLVGRPNVGKSSLFNALLASDRAIVTDIPGTTRDTLEERLQWDGFAVLLTDTAGLRDTTNAIEQHGVERSKAALHAADAVLWVLDGSQPLLAEDKELLKTLRGKRVIGVLNKSDQGIKIKGDDLGPDVLEVVATSALTGAGLENLKKAVLKSVRMTQVEVEGGLVITQLRHVAHLENALKEMEACRSAVQAGRSEELVSIRAHTALRELGQITGETTPDDILSAIFSRFCIGK